MIQRICYEKIYYSKVVFIIIGLIDGYLLTAARWGSDPNINTLICSVEQGSASSENTLVPLKG